MNKFTFSHSSIMRKDFLFGSHSYFIQPSDIHTERKPNSFKFIAGHIRCLFVHRVSVNVHLLIRGSETRKCRKVQISCVINVKRALVVFRFAKTCELTPFT